MKLRYFSDENIQFNIGNFEGYVFRRLKDVIPMLYEISDNTPKEQRSSLMPNVFMREISRQRSSAPNHILHFCESASFFFDSKIKLYQADFKFRDTYDLNSGGARLYIGDDWLEYYDHTLGDRNADDYFRNKCEDRELAEFLLSLKEPITY